MEGVLREKLGEEGPTKRFASEVSEPGARLGARLVLLVPRIKDVLAGAQPNELVVQRIHEGVNVNTRKRPRTIGRENTVRQAARSMVALATCGSWRRATAERPKQARAARAVIAVPLTQRLGGPAADTAESRERRTAWRTSVRGDVSRHGLRAGHVARAPGFGYLTT